jgi:uncharacterized protein (DUF362 family)/Pyruvate/2-oxoacid:ferredoxin oxidoreductase delta subunit
MSEDMQGVSIVRCGDYKDAYRSVERAVALIGGIDRFVKPGARVLIKPNMLAGKAPEKAVTTHPEVVRAVIRLVNTAGGIPAVGDSNALGSFRRVAEVTGIAAVAAEEGAALIELSEAVKVGGKGVFKHFEISRDVMAADAVINLPKVKTHGQMLLTLSVKNLFGCIPGRRKVQWHLKAGVDRNAFATMLVELCGIIKPVLNIADGVVGMEGNGPGNGTPRGLGFIAAGADALCLDMVIADMLGVGPDKLPTTRVAREKGIAPVRVSDIGLLGDFNSTVEARVEKFKLPSGSNLEWTIPEPVRKLLKESLTTKPRIDKVKCQLCMMCHTICPAKAISENRKELKIDYRNCIRCFCCQEVCPVGAIDVVEGWLLRYIG